MYLHTAGVCYYPTTLKASQHLLCKLTHKVTVIQIISPVTWSHNWKHSCDVILNISKRSLKKKKSKSHQVPSWMKEFFFLSVKYNSCQLLKKLTLNWVVSASPLRSSVWKGQYQQCYVLVLQATAHKTLVRDSLTKSTGWRGWRKEGVKLQDETLLSFHSYFLKAK